MSGETLYDKLEEVGDGLTNQLVGEISTLLDSILADERQVKAAKDLARGIIWRLGHERARIENRLLIDYWRNPKLALIPEWQVSEEKKQDPEKVVSVG